MKLSLSYYNVLMEAQVDMDSSLMIASRYQHISRYAVIAEGFNDKKTKEYFSLIDIGKIKDLKSVLNTAKGEDRLKLLVLLGAYYAFHPTASKENTEQGIKLLILAKNESKYAKSDKWFGQSNCLLGKSYYRLNNPDSAAVYFIQASKTFKNIGDKQNEAKVYDYQGVYAPFANSTLEFRISSLNKALALYEHLGDKPNEVNTLMNLAYLSFAAKNVSQSEIFARKSLALQKSSGYPFSHYGLKLFTIFSIIKGRSAETLSYALQTVQSAEKINDSLCYPASYGTVGQAYMLNQRSDDVALLWMNKSLDCFKKLRLEGGLYRIVFATAELFLRQNKNWEAVNLVKSYLKNSPPRNPVALQDGYTSLANGYEKLGKLYLSETYYLKAEKLQPIIRQIHGDLNEGILYYKIGLFYNHAKNYDKAKIYLKKFLSSPSRKTAAIIMTADTYEALYKIDSIAGDYRAAMQNIKYYARIKDTLFSETQSKEIASLRVQYETVQKEKDLQMLQAKSEYQTQQASTNKKIAIASLIVLILIIVLIYSRYLNKQKSNHELILQKKEIDEKNRLLEHLLSEKEWLLKEVHHRVKNNLHTVICLLESQATYLKDDALKAIEVSQHRIYAMSLIHQKLYQSDDVKTIDMWTYLEELIGYLSDSFGVDDKIHFQLDLEEIKLDLSHAIPLSIIVNEAITNSIKYAFTGKKYGSIFIGLQRKNDLITLTIGDNGIGIDENLLKTSEGSLGLKLIKGLSEDIDADISITNSKGTCITITFSVNELHHVDDEVSEFQREE